MNTLFRHNRRSIGWLLTIAFLVMTSASGASWRCLDGTPCPANCPMLHAVAARLSAHAVSIQAHCAHCPAASVSAQSNRTSPACRTSKCVLSMADRPAASLRTRGGVLATPLALLQQPASLTLDEAPTFVAVASLPFFPQRLLRPHPGRAPPALL